MGTNETLHDIIDAADPRDRKDAAIRKSLVAAFESTLANCPREDCGSSATEPTAGDADRFQGFCLLKRSQCKLRACRTCLLAVSTDERARDLETDVQDYEFTAAELTTLGSWYSAIKYAFPGARASLCVNHDAGYSRVRLYEGAWGTTPTTVIFKHRLYRRVRFSWLTVSGDVHGPFARLTEITEPQFHAVEVPSDETAWLDLAGWQHAILARTIIHRRL